MVVNLEDGLAVTHNFCSPDNLADVLETLRDTPEAVSGVPPGDAPLLYARFRAALAARAPAALAEAEAAMQPAEAATVADAPPAEPAPPPRCVAAKWGSVVAAGSAANGTFSFGFHGEP